MIFLGDTVETTQDVDLQDDFGFILHAGARGIVISQETDIYTSKPMFVIAFSEHLIGLFPDEVRKVND